MVSWFVLKNSKNSDSYLLQACKQALTENSSLRNYIGLGKSVSDIKNEMQSLLLQNKSHPLWREFATYLYTLIYIRF